MTIRFQPVSGCALRALRPLSAALLCSTALMGNARAANPVLPTGGQAAAGQVSMSRTAGAQLTIVQTSQSAVINWQDFSIGVGASVNISQPNAAAALLNRVTGDTATTISGALNANGQVYLVNPNGVVISKSGLIIAGAFVASTLGISDSDFMAGNRSFSGHGSSASVSNSGAVILGRGGYAALMGGAVDNAGVISAPLGKVALASGERVTLDLSGDGFIQVALPTEAAGPGALINSSGLLSAAGGVIEIRAATALNAARNAVSLSGVADATAVSGANGRVILSGGTGGEVTVSGALMAPAPMGVGGSVSVDGVRVTLDGAMIDVSGAAGGGTIQIGGPVHGDLSSPQSTLTTIDAATILKADAVRTGPGGTLSIWSTGDTLYLGSLSARGGTEGGDGGSAEISAAGGLTFNGAVDLSAPNGKAGRLLLDPATLRVNQSTATSIGSVLNGGADVRIQTTSWAYSASPGVAISNQNTVLGDTSGDITINAPISWSSSAKLTISSFHSLNILAPITLSGAGSLDLETNAGNSGSDGALSFGLTANGFRGQVSYTGVGGSLTINGAAYTLLYSLTDIGDIPANSNGNFALAASLTGTGTADGAQFSNALVSHFGGIFEGLGHTITNLTINANNDNVGLFSSIYGGVRDLGLLGGYVTGNNQVGAVAGAISDESGAPAVVENVYSSANVTGNGLIVGGLVGMVDSGSGGVTIRHAYVTGAVTTSATGGYVGGLVGYTFSNGGLSSINNAYATGRVSGGAVGDVGGLVGLNQGGSLTAVYATGDVSGLNGGVGGLVGVNIGGAATARIDQAFATGAVSGSGGATGGLVGSNTDAGGYPALISNAYATGPVSSPDGYVGGLVGQNQATGQGASISAAYATGAVLSAQAVTGGLVGVNDGGVITSTGFDRAASGVATAIGADNHDQSRNVAGLTTALLQSDGLASLGVTGDVWAGGANGLYPYLTAVFPNGVQSISGTIYDAPGGHVVGTASQQPVLVGAVDKGAQLGSAYAGANGYYYILVPSGSITAGDAVASYLTVGAGLGVADQQAAAVKGLDLYQNSLHFSTTQTTLSAAEQALGAGFLSAAGSVASAQNAVAKAAGRVITALGPSFDIDHNITTSSLFGVISASTITVDQAITINGGGALSLLASGALSINAPVVIDPDNGVGAAVILQDQGTASALRFGFGANGFAGSLTFDGSSGNAQRLSINGAPYSLLYSLTDLLQIDAQNPGGFYAMAQNMDGGSTFYSTALVGQTNATPFGGVFEGLGHVVTNLNITTTGAAGLFGYVNGGTIRNLGVSGGAVSGVSNVGALVGLAQADLITQSFAATGVRGQGDNVGGLVGAQIDGTVSTSYASGSVTAEGNQVGGLIGYFEASNLSQAAASGAVAATGPTSQNVGGLVGESIGTASADAHITDTYATGAVTGAGNIGGLVGQNKGDVPGGAPSARIETSYATGLVHQGVNAGGLVGDNESGGTVVNSAYDRETTGQIAAFGADPDGSTPAATAMTTSGLQTGGLPTGFSRSIWSGGGGGLYPYLTVVHPDGVQAVSGYAYQGLSHANAGLVVNLDRASGSLGFASTGASGYYYLLLDGAPIASNDTVLAYANGGQGAAAAASMSPSGVTISGLNLYDGAVRVTSAATRYSLLEDGALLAPLLAAAGADQTAASLINATSGRYYQLSGSSFTIDAPVNSTVSRVFDNTTGLALTVAQPINVSGSGGLFGLLTGGVLSIDAPITVSGGTAVALNYNSRTQSSLNFNLTADGFAGSLTFGGSQGTGATLSVNGASLALVYTEAQLRGVALDQNWALANNLILASSYDRALIGADADAFSGRFEGLGHTISGLNITSTASNVGLFGQSSGTIENLGLVDGQVASRGGSNIGGLVGSSSGQLFDVYSTLAVSGSGNVGGLIGQSSGGVVTTAFATGPVNGAENVGGLVGAVAASTVRDSFATGAVTGANPAATGLGGLVGALADGASLSDVYATGAVIGGQFAGGLVGYYNPSPSAAPSSVTNAYSSGYVSGSGGGSFGGTTAPLGGSIYFDTGTSGRVNGAGSLSGVTGLTTAQLQGTASSGPVSISIAFSGGVNGLYPYLTNFYPNGVQAVTGQTTNAVLNTAVNGGATTISAYADGRLLGASGPGANGVYYIAVPAGDITGNSQLLTFMSGASGLADGVSATQGSAGALQTALPIVSGAQTVITSASSLSTSTVTFDSLQAQVEVIQKFLHTSNMLPGNLHLIATGDFQLDQSIRSSGDLSIVAQGGLTLGATVSVANDTSLKALHGGIDQLSGEIITDGLTLTANGPVVLMGDNRLTRLESISTDGGNLTLHDVSATTGLIIAGPVRSAGAVEIDATGPLTLSAGAHIFSQASDTAVILSAGGAFSNAAGGDVISAPNGRWLVYLSDPHAVSQTYGGLDSENTAVWNTAAGATTALGGNRYVFAYQPVLSVQTTSDAKTYGADATPALGGDYRITGLEPGVAGAYLGDLAPSAYGGAPAVTSVGAAATANVTPGGYSIIASMGNLQTHLGYGLAFSNTGVLTVSPRAVTVTALGGASTYGDSPTNPGLAASGLVNGDTVAALTGLASSFNINAQTHAGTIALSVIGANTDADYAVTTQGGSWTVSPRAVTVTALGGTSTYGDSPTNPGLAASGLVNGDTVAALSGLANSFGVTASTAPGPLGVAVRGALANSNYTLIGTVSGTWTINPEALTIAADNQSRPQAVANPDLTYRITQGALLNGDQLSGGLATLANVQSPPGVYDITQGDLAGQNYRITFIPGAVTVLGSAAPGTTLSSALTTTPGWDQYKISTRVVISSDTFAAPQQTAISVEGLDQVLVIVDPRYATPSVCLEGWSCVAISPASHASRQTSDAGRIRTDGPAPAQPPT